MSTPPINDSRRQDGRRRQADALAEALSQEQGLRTLRWADRLLGLGAVEAAPSVEETVPEPSTGPRPISLWQPKEEGGEWFFERPPVGPFGDHYAARRRFAGRKDSTTRRFVFLGESVAAGYLYAPHITPAEVLQRRLDELSGRSVEVIDLARTNETIDSMVATLDASLQLEVDGVVIFAGNNWTLLETPDISPYAATPRQRQRYAEVWSRSADGEGAEVDPVAAAHGVARLAARQLRRKVLRAFADVASRLADIPVVWVLPESHLQTWQVLQPVLWLADDGSPRWYALYDAARRQLRQGRFKEAAASARAMATLDGGTCPTSPRLLFHALQGLGDAAGARHAARQHIDGLSYAHLGFLASPQASSGVHRLIRELCGRHGWQVVDLPQRFADATAEGLPGDDLFVDYCHLSLRGMDLAMTATARQLLPDGDGVDPSPHGPDLPDLDVAAGIEATAYIGAAVHGAHRHVGDGFGDWPLRTWLQRAADADDGALDIMEDLLEARSAPGPAVMTAAQERQLRHPYPLLLQHGWRWPWLDIDLLDALCDVLESRGRTPRPGLHRRLLAHHGVDFETRDLSRAPYLYQPLMRLFPEVMENSEPSRRATCRVPWPWIDTCLIGQGQDLQLDLVARLPAIAETRRVGDLTILLDGQHLARCPLTSRWTRHRLAIPRARLGSVIHRLRLCWPPLPALGNVAMADALRRLDMGRSADLHPVFGEIYRLDAQRAKDLP